MSEIAKPDADAELRQVHAVLLKAMGGPDGVPEGISTLNLAHAAASDLGGLRNGLMAAGRMCGKWGNLLGEHLAETDQPDPRVVKVYEQLTRHRPQH